MRRLLASCLTSGGICEQESPKHLLAIFLQVAWYTPLSFRLPVYGSSPLFMQRHLNSDGIECQLGLEDPALPTLNIRPNVFLFNQDLLLTNSNLIF
jgi:hypothetical protein